MAFGLGRLPSYGGVYSRAQKTWVNSIVRVGGKGSEREEGEKAKASGARGGRGRGRAARGRNATRARSKEVVDDSNLS